MFYIGKPCKKGHDGTRYVANRNCVTCTNEDSRDRQRKGLDRANNRSRMLRYQKRHPDRANARNRAYHAKHPEKTRARINKRRSIKHNAEGQHSAFDIKSILAAQGSLCFYCGVPLSTYHVDHFIPLSKGGTNYRCNIVLACATCNLRKGSRAPIEFLNWQMKNPPFWHERKPNDGYQQTV